MALDVEAIWVALFERLQENADGFATFSRRRILDPAPEQCPLLMLLDDSGNETADENTLPPVWTIDGEIVIVARSEPKEGEAPSTELNALIKSVRGALERKPADPLGSGDFSSGPLGYWTNLGGLVRTLHVSSVEKGSLGETTGRAVARMSIEMEALG